MKYILIIFLSSSFNLFAQNDIAGLYNLSAMTYSCTLDLKTDSTYTQHCEHHMWKPDDFSGNWIIKMDTIILLKDSVNEKILIKNNDFLNTHFGSEQSEIGKKVFYIPIYYKKVHSYYPNGKIKISKSWKTKKNQSYEFYPHGYWKYFDLNSTIFKLEKYRKGKIKRTYKDTLKIQKRLNKID